MAKQTSTPAPPPPATKAPPGKRPAATRPAPARAVTRGRLAGRFEGLRKAFRETMAELRKVQWPDRLTTRNLTLVVIGMSVTLAAVLGLFDALLTRLFEWLIRL